MRNDAVALPIAILRQDAGDIVAVLLEMRKNQQIRNEKYTATQNAVIPIHRGI